MFNLCFIGSSLPRLLEEVLRQSTLDKLPDYFNIQDFSSILLTRNYNNFIEDCNNSIKDGIVLKLPLKDYFCFTVLSIKIITTPKEILSETLENDIMPLLFLTEETIAEFVKGITTELASIVFNIPTVFLAENDIVRFKYLDMVHPHLRRNSVIYSLRNPNYLEKVYGVYKKYIL